MQTKAQVRKQKDPKWIEAGKKANATRKKRLEEMQSSMKKNPTADEPSEENKAIEQPTAPSQHEEDTTKWHSTSVFSSNLSVKYGKTMQVTDFVDKPWVEKYRPSSLSQCIGGIIPYLKAYVKTGSMPAAFILYGEYGDGKTTSAKAFIRDFFVARGLFHREATFKDVTSASNITKEYEGIFPPALYVDASSFKGSESLVLEEVKERVHNFMRYSVGKWTKFVIIDEADRFGFAVQDAISSYIERYPNTRIIWITNYLDAIRDRIISRAAGGVFEYVKPEAKEVAKYLAEIAKEEHVRIKEATLLEIASKAPSVRDAVGLLQQKATLLKCEREK
jgi:DNA polymerase III gamma/tau subunit